MSSQKLSQHPIVLDEYEASLEKAFDELKPLSKKEKSKHLALLKKAANNYTKKDKRISIRVYGSDLENIKRFALNEGLPYQTLITSVLHKFATGQLLSHFKMVE